MKRTLLFILFTLFLIEVNGQSLTINETINYINDIYYNNRISERYNYLSLLKDGTLTLINGGSGWSYIMQISEVEVYDIHDEGFKIECTQLDLDHPSVNGLYFTDKCILTEVTTGARQGPENFIYISLDDPYILKKLNNAYKYLFDLVRLDGSYIRKDDDPFAPNNFNPNSLDIEGAIDNENIKLEKVNGVYHVFVIIGNIKENFIIDTGASEVSLSEDVEKALINAGVITKENYLESGLYKLADGSIVQCRRVMLPKIKIGNFTVNNVEALIGSGSTPLLLGKSFLDKFKKWTIDNVTQTLILEK